MKEVETGSGRDKSEASDQAVQWLTEQIARSMVLVKRGADVYDPGIARDLREVERHRPDYIWIGPASDPPKDGAARQPYFGAILTQNGIAAARRAIRLAIRRGATHENACAS